MIKIGIQSVPKKIGPLLTFYREKSHKLKICTGRSTPSGIERTMRVRANGYIE